MSYLILENISKIYNNKTVLHNISVNIDKGKILAVAGPPGSGKTTLLKIIAGLITPTSGRILIEGVDITNKPPYERGFSMVFEIPPVYPDRTGYDNIAFPLRIRKLPENEIKRRVEEIAELLNIKHILSRKPSTYSGGEYQRVALARALVLEPRVLLLDEPLKNLDAKIRESMVTWLKDLQRRLGVTIIYATHDPLEAMTIGDKVMILLNGYQKQVSTPSELLLKPVDLDVDEYISIPALNVIKSKIIEVFEDNISLQLGKHVIKVRKQLPMQLSSKEVFIAIRPSDIIVSDRGEEKMISGKVSSIQYYGRGQLLTIESEDLVFRVVVDRLVSVGEGDVVYMDLPSDKIRIYDIDSRRLLG